MTNPITSADQLHGLWKLHRTEIAGYDTELESLEFRPDGGLEWCLKPSVGEISRNQRCYQITDSGFNHAAKPDSSPVVIQAWFDDGDLVIIPPHGHKSWFSRCDKLSKEANPQTNTPGEVQRAFTELKVCDHSGSKIDLTQRRKGAKIPIGFLAFAPLRLCVRLQKLTESLRWLPIQDALRLGLIPRNRACVVECGGKPWRDTAVASRTVFSGLFTFFTRSTAVSPMRGSAFASLPPHSTTLPRLVMRFSQFGTQCVPNFGHSVSKIYSPLNV
jgi:hypothetical protein